MDNEYVKKLTGKNPQDFEFAAAHVINNCDVKTFQALVDKSDFLFDFIKENVKNRLSNAVNISNYKNLFHFLKIYSADYEDFIISSFYRYADEELTDKMLELLEIGTDEEKAYAAKYFSRVNDTLALDLLKKYAFSEFDALALNCAQALSAMNDEESYSLAMEKVKSQDEFEKLLAVRFLVAYNDLSAINVLFETMKNSQIPENIASEISYLQSFLELLDTDFKYDTVLAVNNILNGLGEIISLSQVFDFELFEVFEKLIEFQAQEKNSKIATVLLNAKIKFEQLTENEEYIFDEDKNTKQEIYAIKNRLNSQPQKFWDEQTKLFQKELFNGSDFVFFALELVQELGLTEAFGKLKELLNSQNQTIVLKTVEVLKSLNKLGEIDKKEVLKNISDENIKTIIQSLFN